MTKTKYMIEIYEEKKLILVHLLTFDIIVLDEHDIKGWNSKHCSTLNKQLKDDLYRRHFLVKTLNEDVNLLRRAKELFSNKPLSVPTMALYLTNDCNLKCSYCYTGYQKDNGLECINISDVNNAFEAIKEIYKIGNYLNEKPYITILGGEPLLPKNKEVLRYIIKKLNEKGYDQLEIITNLVNVRLFEDELKLFNGIVNLRVTFNGAACTHDKIRTFSNGQGTYDVIIKNIKYVLENIPNISIDISVLIEKSITDNSIVRLFDDLNYNGLLDSSKISITFGHIQFRSNYVCPGYEKKVIDVSNYYPMLFDFQKKCKYIKDEMVEGSSVHILKSIYNRIKKNEMVLPSFAGCDCIYPGRICFYTDGYIYPCYDCVGMSDFRIGEYRNKITFYDQLFRIKGTVVSEFKKCNNCKFVGVCSGGCLVSNYSKNGSFDNAFCEDIENAFIKFFKYLYKEGHLSGL